jgi:D-sedoheptulose 7-phosphate isomerase
MQYKTPTEILEKMIDDNPALAPCKQAMEQAFSIIKGCYKAGGKVLICGNGGSASDSEHIVGEFMKGFTLRRPLNAKKRALLTSLYPEDGEYLADNLQGALPAISLVSQTALSSAFINDVAPDMVFAQQVYGYTNKGDVILGLSTSGNSRNVVNAVKVGKALGAKCIAMTGEGNSLLSGLCDTTLRSPAKETYRVQEYHLMMYHALCAMVEAEFFDQ